LTVGSSLLEGKTLYPTMEVNESPWDPAAGVWVVDDNPSDDAQLAGYATDRSDTALITSILGGVTCGE
jgi:hypothetical protein